MPPKEEILIIHYAEAISSADEKTMLGETGPFVVCI